MKRGEIFAEGVLTLCFSPSGRWLAVGGVFEDGGIRIWDAKVWRVVRTIEAGAVYPVAFSPDGKHLAAGGRLPDLALWDVITGRHVRTFQDSGVSVEAVAFSPDGKLLASAENTAVKVWRVPGR